MRLRMIVPLAAILALAIGLRVWGLGWGMPYAFHADEANYLPGAVGMLFEGDPNPHYFANPPLLTYTVLLELLLYLQVGRLLGLLQSAADIGHQLLVSPTPLYLMARMNSALMGTATVLLVYMAARRLFGRPTGLAAALLMAVAFLHVRDSHYVVNDVPATFWLMVSFYFASRILRSPRLRDYLLGGAFLGLAVATKYNVGLGAAFLVAAHLARPRKAGEAIRPSTHLPLVAAGAASLLAFVLSNPFSILDYPAFLRGFTGQYGWSWDPYNTTDRSIGLVILRALATGTSPILVALSALGLGLMAFRHPREALLVAAFPLAYLAFFLLGSSLFYARFAIPLIPFVALLAAHGIVALARPLPSPAWRRRAAVAVVLLLALQPLALDLKHNYLLGREDTRLQLGRWIEENVPPGSKLAAEGYSFVDSRGRRTGPKQLDYSLAQPSSLMADPLEHYSRGFDYLIASSYVYGRYTLDPAAHRDAIEYYRLLDRSFPVVAQFFHTDEGVELPFIMDDEITPIWTVLERARPGPTLKVYRVGEPPQYRVRWLEATVPEQLSPGQRLKVPATLSNEGNLVWPFEGYTPVRVGYRWRDGSGQEVKAPDLRSSLPAELQPGDQVAVQLDLVAPSTPGVYTLQLDLVWENFAWFSSKGGETRDFRVTVR
ncbi:MAG: glycosyltransferase family 39 protein [Chloroflexota bacterium]